MTHPVQGDLFSDLLTADPRPGAVDPPVRRPPSPTPLLDVRRIYAEPAALALPTAGPAAKASFATKHVNPDLLDWDPRGRTRIRPVCVLNRCDAF